MDKLRPQHYTEPMPANRTPTVYPSIDDLIGAVPSLAPHRRWLIRAWAFLGPPSVAMLLPALQQLRILAQTLGWQLPLVSDRSDMEYERLLEQLQAAPGMDVPL